MPTWTSTGLGAPLEISRPSRAPRVPERGCTAEETQGPNRGSSAYLDPIIRGGSTLRPPVLRRTTPLPSRPDEAPLDPRLKGPLPLRYMNHLVQGFPLVRTDGFSPDGSRDPFGFPRILSRFLPKGWIPFSFPFWNGTSPFDRKEDRLGFDLGRKGGSLVSRMGFRIHGNRTRRDRSKGSRMRCAPTTKTCSDLEPRGRLGRRKALQASLVLLLGRPSVARARTVPPPPGYRFHRDRLDGYAYIYPSDWIAVTTAGADSFYRSQSNLEENVFVDVSSPSSSEYNSVRDLGNEADVGKRVLDQYLVEFMSTRLGVKRESEVVEAAFREAPDGNLYCDVMLRLKSYVNSNQFGITPDERVQYLEWDRVLLATLGVANRRLYQLRIQTPTATFLDDVDRLQMVRDSFRVFDTSEEDV